MTLPAEASLTGRLLAAGRRWAPRWIKHPVWLALQRAQAARRTTSRVALQRVKQARRAPATAATLAATTLAAGRRWAPWCLKHPVWLALQRARQTRERLRERARATRAVVGHVWYLRVKPPASATSLAPAGVETLARLTRAATDAGVAVMWRLAMRLAMLKDAPRAAARRWTPSQEWIGRSYQAHFSGSHTPGVSRLRRVAEGTVAGAAMLYVDHSYRKLLARIHGHHRVPLLRRPDFRPGATLLCTGSLGPGGSERQIVTTLLGMVRAGYGDLSLVCQYLNTRPHDFYRCLLDDTPVLCSELRSAEELWRGHDLAGSATAAVLNDILRPLPPALRDIERFVLELLDRRPEVVHAWLDETNVKAGIAAAVVGVPRIVLSTRSVAPANFPLFQPYMREAYRALARLPNVCLLNNSQAGARSYERWLGLPVGRFRVLPNGFDFGTGAADTWELRRRYRARYGIDDSRLVLGSVMRFYEEKRPLLWFETALEVARRVPEAAFLVIGNGPFRQAVRERAEEAGLGPRFFLPGHDANAIDAMAAMDVFLLTSRMEGLPNVLIEAQAMGIPVVTTDAGGASETLSPGETGYAIKPHTAALLADAVVRIMADTAFRRAVRTRAPAFVRERFDVQHMVQETIAVYYDGRNFATMNISTNA